MTDLERPQVVLVNRCIVRDDEDRILLIKRSPTDRNNASKWEFPGGKLDVGQDLSHALEREVMEETGLLVEPSYRLVYADSYVIGEEPYKGMPYVVLFGLARVVGGRMRLSDEHTDSAWETYEQALDFDLTPEIRKALIVLGSTVLQANQEQ